LVPSIIDGPVSVPVDGSNAYPVDYVIEGNTLTVDVGPLVNKFERVVGPPLSNYMAPVTFALDFENCNYHREWIENGELLYELWLFRDGILEFHFGDWEAGHGNSLLFGVWHVVYAQDPDFAVQKRMIAND
jgi:hypothetical protein